MKRNDANQVWIKLNVMTYDDSIIWTNEVAAILSVITLWECAFVSFSSHQPSVFLCANVLCMYYARFSREAWNIEEKGRTNGCVWFYIRICFNRFVQVFFCSFQSLVQVCFKRLFLYLNLFFAHFEGKTQLILLHIVDAFFIQFTIRMWI